MMSLRNVRQCLEQHQTDPDLTHTIYYCLHQTFAGAPVDPVMIPSKYLSTVLQQNRIGWLSFLKGLFHRDWIKHQDTYYVSQHLRTHKLNGMIWGRKVLSTIWAGMNSLWITYTNMLHQSTSTNPSIVHRQLQAKIRELQKTYWHYCAHLDQRYLLSDKAITDNTHIRLHTWFLVQAPVLQKEITIAQNQQNNYQRTMLHYYWRSPAQV